MKSNTLSPQSPILPEEFYNVRSFFTLSGSAAAVWLFCLVIHSIFHKSLNQPDHYKLIALALSELIAFAMFFESKRKNLKSGIITLFNGILIFIYATGFNTISANLFSEKQSVGNSIQAKIFLGSVSSKGHTVAAFFISDINWWQDKRTTIQLDTLKRRVHRLEEENTKLKIVPIDSLETRTIRQLNQTIDSLKNIVRSAAKHQSNEPAQNNALNNQLDDCLKSNQQLNNRFIQKVDSLEISYRKREELLNKTIESYRQNLDKLQRDLRNSRHGQSGIL